MIEGKFTGGLFFYKDLQVSTKKLGPVFREVDEHVVKYTKSLPKQVVYTSGAVFYDDPGLLVDENKHRASIGVLIRVRNSTIEDYFKNLGYKAKELPQSVAVYTSHPNRLYKFGIQYVIAAIRCYPRLYDFFAENSERYKSMLKG